jgi:bifunctional non-homologous end joining protein LigD
MEKQPSGIGRKAESRMARRRSSPRREEKENESRGGLHGRRGKQKKNTDKKEANEEKIVPAKKAQPEKISPPKEKKPQKTSVSSVVKPSPTPEKPTKRPMPQAIYPMLAESVNEPFDSKDWLFEIKWDGYRAIAFIENGKARLVSRNQNELTARYPELKDMPKFIQAKIAILDGEVVALDDDGRPSFSLMQQRTGFRPGGKRGPSNADVPVLYYAFDLIYLDGYDYRKVPVENRKEKLKSIIKPGDALRYSDHYLEHGKALFDVAKGKSLEGIVAKRRSSYYEERRSHDWLKIKIRHQVECVIGGYTPPEGTRAHFGSLVLGLYDKGGNLIHVGQAGSGFNQKTLVEIWGVLKKLETKTNPFYGDVEALRKTFWVKPELVAQIEFSEWTGGTNTGVGPKLRAPVFLGLRDDKEPRECLLDEARRFA